MAATGLFVLTQPAAAAAPLNCLNTIYYTSSAGTIRQVDLNSRTLLPGQPYQALPDGSGDTANQNGVGAGGAIAIHGTSTSIVRYTPALDQTTVIAKPSGVGSGTVGAINPRTGLYYYGAYGTAGNPASVLSLYVYDPTSNVTQAPAGVVANVTVNNPPGGNGDIAFDEAGRLYMVSGAGASPFGVALYRMNGTIPTGGATQSFTSTEITRGNNTGSTNGIAFASDGYLYISTGTSIRQLNPITGTTVGTDISLPGAGITDLGTCAGPSTVQAGATFPGGRVNPTDQFTIGLTGNDYQPDGSNTGNGPRPNPTATTSGTNPSATTAPSIVLPGQSYTVVQSPVGTTNPNNYVTTFECRGLDGALIAAGNGSPGTVTIPTGTDGNSITCTFRNDLPVPSIDLTKTVSPTSFSLPGTVLTYTFAVRNTGNTVLNNYTVTDTMPGLGALTCSPALGSTLQPNGTATCSATYTVTAADVLAAAPKVNNATAGGTPPTGQGTTVTDGGTATAGFLAIPPAGVNDTGAAAFNQSVTVAGSTNDTPGNGTINHALTVFTAPGASNGGKTLTTDQGTWNIQPNGTAVFTPVPGYVGTTPAAQYRITDSNGQTATATVAATIRPGPVANPNSTTTNQDQNAVLDVLANDVPGQLANGSAGTRNVTSVVFPSAGQPAGATVTDAGRTLTVPNQGVYTADPVTGVVTFDPAPTFTGTTTSVNYSFSDSNGNSATSTITVTVNPVNPVATDDAVNTVFGTAVTLPAGTNDLPGPGGAINHALTVFTSGSATNGGKTLVTPEGSWNIQPDGTVVFDPATGYVGTTPTVEYRITDANGQTDTATLQVTVRPGPTAAPDTITTQQNVTVILPSILGNDVAGLEADGSPGTLVVSSGAFQTAGLPAGSTVSEDEHTLTVPGQGVYTYDPANGEVTFDPEPQFSGVATPVVYTVLDQSGNVASSTITVTVDAITPTAVRDDAKTPSNTPVELNVAANDTPGAPSAPIVPGSILFTSPEATSNGTVLTVPGEGTWEILADGVVRFTPEPTFDGATSAVEYSIEDANGTAATANIVVIVGAPPLAVSDATTTPQNTDVTLDVLLNDVAGDQGTPCVEPGSPAGCDTGTLVSSSVVFPASGQPDGAEVSADGKTITVPGEGVWTIDGTTGAITFDPETTFTGAAQVSYSVTDSYGQTATTTATVTVRPINPTATNDTAQTPFNNPVQLSGALNDVAGVDEPTGVTAPLQPALTVFPIEGQPADVEISDDGKTLTVPNQGRYEIAADGSVTFTPVDGYVGTTTAVTYRIVDANGTIDDATLAVTVRPGPAAQTDLVRSTPEQPVLQGQPVTISPLTNDTPSQNADGAPGAFLPETVVFPTAGQPAGAEVTDDGKTLTVPGQGTWTANPDGTVTFQPEPGFSGSTSPVTYEVTDTHGNTTGSTVVVIVDPVKPTAILDEAATPFNTPVTFPFASNDVAGNPVAPIVPASATFEPADQPEGAEITDGGKTITVPGEGSFTLNDDGTVLFTPEPTFTGVTSLVAYTIRDANGTASSSTLEVTVQVGPEADPDTNETPQNTPVDTDVLDNDTPGLLGDGNDGAWDPASLVFPTDGQPAGATVASDGKSVVVPNEGTYSVVEVGDSVEIRFEPVPTFRGEAAPVTYAVTDTNGNSASSTLTITVLPIDPTADPDTAITAFDTPVVINTKLNDTAGTVGGVTAPILDEATVFPTEAQPAGAIIAPDGKSIEIPEQGTYVVNNDGTVTFTPVTGFSGIATGVTYQIADSNGTTDTATITVTVRQGPTAVDDEGETDQNVTVTVNVLTNDVPGRDVENNDLVEWQPTSVVFLVDGQPAGASVTDEGKTLTVPGQGVYTVEPDGQITFDPEPQFRGDATGVVYSVTDTLNNAVTAVLTIAVEGIDPIATDDSAGTPFNTPVTLPGVLNDAAGAVSAPLVPGATVFPIEGQPEGAIVAPDGKSVEVPAQGTYVIDDLGQITFTPVDGYVGTTTPVTYRIEDANGTTDTALVSVIVQEGPIAAPVQETTPQNVNVDIDVTANDQTGLNADGETRAEWDFSSLVFPVDGQPVGATVTDEGRTLTVPGEGVYTADPTTGIVTFDPEPQFRSTTTPVTYQVADALGNPVQSTITVIVTPIDPKPTNDRLPTPFNTPITLPGVLNDAPGETPEGEITAPLVPEATTFPEAGQPESAVRSDDGKTLEVPNQGTWTVNPDGSVTFTPAPGFVGPTTPVTYQVVDTNGTTATADLTVDVRQGPSAAPDFATTPQNIPVTVPVLGLDDEENPGRDTPGQNADGTLGDLLPEGVVFTPEGQPEGSELSEDGKTLVVPGQGTWTVTDNGEVVFTPEPQFVGETSPVIYEVTDSLGNPATAPVVVTVTPITPLAIDDNAGTPFNTPVTVPGALNDVPGADSAPLVPEATVFTADGQPEGAQISEDGKTLVVPGEGTWTVNPDGTITFVPEPGFAGLASPITYRITDSNGTTDTATVTVTVQPGPVAVPDTGSGKQGQPLTLNPIINGVAGPNADGSAGQLDPTTVVFPITGQPDGAQVSPDGRTLTVPGVGVYTADPVTGVIVFTPESQFTGTAPSVSYQVTDNHGNPATSTVVVDITAVQPVAANDSASTPYNTPVTLDVLANDGPGDAGIPLDPSTLVLIDGAGNPVTTLVVPGEGTWTVVDGKLVFTPEPGFTGTTTPVTYQVSDVNGTPVTATAVVEVRTEGAAQPDRTVTAPATGVTVPVLDNDTPAQGEEFLPDTLCLVDGSDCVKTVTRPGVGTWQVNPDGTITFTPVAGFSGEATIEYRVTDTAGNVYTSTLTVAVDAAPAPGKELPDTGGVPFDLMGWGLALLLAGAALVLRFRRRTA